VKGRAPKVPEKPMEVTFAPLKILYVSFADKMKSRRAKIVELPFTTIEEEQRKLALIESCSDQIRRAESEK
jgi:hypothetical protein